MDSSSPDARTREEVGAVVRESVPETITVLQIAATYIGTVVGAGFASGQEVLQFFGRFGMQGVLGIALAGILFAYCGFIVLELGRRLGATSHLGVIASSTGRLATPIDFMVTFFLFGGFVAMIAGSGAVFVEELGMPYLSGGMMMAALTLATVVLGLHSVILAITIFVPFLLLSVLALSYLAVSEFGITPVQLGALDPGSAPVAWWPASAVVYASYNLLTTSSVLAPVGAMATSGRQNLCGAILGGLGLGLGALAIHLGVIAAAPASLGYEIPMICVAGAFGPASKFAYSLVLLGEIYTTAVADLYGLTARLTGSRKRVFRFAAALLTISALVASRMGFAVVVRTVYPAAGYAGLLFLACLLTAPFRHGAGFR